MYIERFFSLSLMLLISFSPIYAQKIVGKISTAKDKNPLQYVNVGVLGGSRGTISDQNGKFELKIDSSNIGDTIRISMIGYELQDLLIKDLTNKVLDIKLKEMSIAIDEIVVSDCKTKNEVSLGNLVKTDNPIAVSFVSEDGGGELATYLKLKRKKKMHLKKFRFFITNNPYATLTLRLNIYDAKKGRPHKNILTKNIIIKTGVKEGVVEIDLSTYNIILEQSSFVSLEGLQISNKNLSFAGRFGGKKSFARPTSQANWIKVPLVNLGFSILGCIKSK